MVAFDHVPSGEDQPRRVGFFEPLWFAGFLLVCGLVALRPTPFRTPGISTALENVYWLYSRTGGNTSAQDPTAEILVVGDVMLGRGVIEEANPFGELRQLLASTDLTVGNFEGVISSETPVIETCEDQSGSMPYRLVAPARDVVLLQEAGFNLLSLANNHSLDLGGASLLDTIERMARAGIKVVGVGSNLETAYRPLIVDIKGVQIGFLAIDAIPEPLKARASGQELQRATWKKDRVLEAIRNLDSLTDIVIILIHWGDEYEIRAGPNQHRAAQEMVDAGADAVIGSHPHVVQETQILEKSDRKKDGFVAYSLGNFVFDQFEENSRIGLALKLVVDRTGLKTIQAVPVHAGPAPELLPPAESEELIDRIRPAPQWMGFQCNQIRCLPDSTPFVGGSGIFESEQIDLTGDGMPETIRLESGRVYVFESHRLAWESPQEWEVLDVALGDPNDDGRAEIMLTLQKLDKTGQLASHPFIIGHRGGIYRQVWGGSAVAIPIQEIELADIDGDRKQELIVLEEQKGGMKTIAVFKWDDWVFRLFWRSAPGRFVDLQVRETGQAQQGITIGKIR
jgi:poly-gamma-glutamate capsule biosynthesis protein CapA/YwtB (metallophosphatase superfamily)